MELSTQREFDGAPTVRLAASVNQGGSFAEGGDAMPAGQTIVLKDGEYLFKAGGKPEGLFLVKSGALKILINRKLSRGRRASPEFISKLASPGEVVGYREMIEGVPYQSFAKSVRSTEVQFFPKETIQKVINGPLTLTKLVLMQAAKDLNRFDTITELHYLASVQERIAHQILILSDQFGVPSEGGILISLKLTRNEFAQLAGTINESFSRHLTELKTEGIIDLIGKDILVKNREALKEKAGQATGK